MSWIPKILLTNRGIIKGKLPFGYYDTAKDYMDTNLQVDGDGARGNKGYQGITAESWRAAYGSDCIDIGDTTGNNQLLLEIKVETPENAPYFAQTLCFKGNISKREVVVTGNSYYEYTINIIDIVRREYEYDGALPTETVLYNTQSQATIVYNRAEDENGLLYTRFIDNLWVALGRTTIGDNKYFGMNFYGQGHIWYQQTPPVDKREWTHMAIALIEYHVLDEAFDGEFLPEEKEDPNEEEPPEDGPGGGGSGGGEGDHILPDEPVPIPPVPEIGAASVSWLKLFKMTTNQLNNFGEAMMPKTAWQLLQIYFNNPLDAIIGVLLIPVDAPTSGARTPALGDFTWPTAYPIINNEFYELDCGAIHIPPYWDSAFDFSPFTKFQVFLPFIGYRDIDADEIMGAGVQIKYHIDLCTGDCTAFIARSAAPGDEYGPRALQVIAQYNGNCAVRVPTARISHDNAVTASMSLLGSAINVGGAIMGAALGNPGNISASQVANQVSGGTMTAVNGMKKELQRSGNIAAAAGYMGILRPYIIRQVPHQDLPKQYKRLEGYPANKGGTLAQFAGTGLNTIEAMELTGFNGFESEREELLSILRGGIIV